MAATSSPQTRRMAPMACCSLAGSSMPSSMPCSTAVCSSAGLKGCPHERRTRTRRRGSLLGSGGRMLARLKPMSSSTAVMMAVGIGCRVCCTLGNLEERRVYSRWVRSARGRLFLRKNSVLLCQGTLTMAGRVC